MTRALILGAHGAIGAAIASALSERADVFGLSRANGLDWMRPALAEEALRRATAEGPYDLIFDATGALEIGGAGPERTVRKLEAADMAAQMAVNAIGPALIFKHHRELVPRKGRVVIATLSARVGSIGDNNLGGWISYRAAKAALNQIVRTSAIEIARYNPDAICVALHPGTVATPLSAKFAGDRVTFSPVEASQRLLGVIDKLTPDQTGRFFAYDGQPIPW